MLTTYPKSLSSLKLRAMAICPVSELILKNRGALPSPTISKLSVLKKSYTNKYSSRITEKNY